MRQKASELGLLHRYASGSFATPIALHASADCTSPGWARKPDVRAWIEWGTRICHPKVVEARLGMVSGMDHEAIEIRECQSQRGIRAIRVSSGRLRTDQQPWSLKERQREHASPVQSLSEGG
jgi:hypothetical protein